MLLCLSFDIKSNSLDQVEMGSLWTFGEKSVGVSFQKCRVQTFCHYLLWFAICLIWTQTVLHFLFFSRFIICFGAWSLYIFGYLGSLVMWPPLYDLQDPSSSKTLSCLLITSFPPTSLFSTLSHSHPHCSHSFSLISLSYPLFLPLYLDSCTDSNTQTTTQLSLFLSLLSATEVRVWVFYPRATQPRFTMTVTPALPATLDSSVSQVVWTPPHHDDRGDRKPPGRPPRHPVQIQPCLAGPVIVCVA